MLNCRNAGDWIETTNSEVQVTQVAKHIGYSQLPIASALRRQGDDLDSLVSQGWRPEYELVVKRRPSIQEQARSPRQASNNPGNFDYSGIQAESVSIGQWMTLPKSLQYAIIIYDVTKVLNPIFIVARSPGATVWLQIRSESSPPRVLTGECFHRVFQFC